MDRTVRRRSRRRLAGVGALVFATLIGVAAATGLPGEHATGVPWMSHGPDAAREAGGTAVTHQAPATDGAPRADPARRAGAAVPQDPTWVRLPSGVLVPVVAVSSRLDGFLDVPPDVETAGWWRGGSRIGDPFGATLVAGHVDSVTQGLGPFAELLSVRPGAMIELGSARLRQTYRVVSLRLLPQGSLDDDRWIHDAYGSRRLVLVTCAPPYERARGGYQNLAVVRATPTGPPTRTRTR